MKIKKNHAITIIAVFGAAFIAIVGQIIIREWYKADIRYEEGSYYTLQNFAVSSLKLKNYGHDDAKNIRLTFRFQNQIEDIRFSDPSVKFSTIDGGLGETHATLEFDRMVPDQTVYIYVVIRDPDLLELEQYPNFLASITFAGGKGKTGLPIRLAILTSIMPFIFSVIISILASLLLLRVYLGKRDSIIADLEQSRQKINEIKN
ncbi:unnamed protein product, partial [marine sediment metagenome]